MVPTPFSAYSSCLVQFSSTRIAVIIKIRSHLYLMKNQKETTNTNHTHNSSNKLLKELKTLLAEGQKLIEDSRLDPSSQNPVNLGKRFDTATHKISEAYKDAKHQTVDSAKATNTFIHKNPYRSLAIAAATGLLTGLLIGRRPEENFPG